MIEYNKMDQSHNTHANSGFSDEELGFNLLTNRTNGGGGGHSQQPSHQSNGVGGGAGSISDSDSDTSIPRFNMGGGSDTDSTPVSPPMTHHFTGPSDDTQSQSSYGSFNKNYNEDAENLEKRKILTKLRRYELRRGIKLNTAVSIHTPLEDLQLELELVNKELNLDKTIEQGKKLITLLAFGIEAFNKKYDPLDVYLDGWSASVNEDIDSYDEILEELYDKYYTSIDASPEIKLIMGLTMSAIMYNVSHKMLSPGNSTFLSKLAKDHNTRQMDSTMGAGGMSGPSGGIADEILQEDLNALRNMKSNGKSPIVRFE
jgi:hypothetical protein